MLCCFMPSPKLSKLSGSGSTVSLTPRMSKTILGVGLSLPWPIIMPSQTTTSNLRLSSYFILAAESMARRRESSSSVYAGIWQITNLSRFSGIFFFPNCKAAKNLKPITVTSRMDMASRIYCANRHLAEFLVSTAPTWKRFSRQTIMRCFFAGSIANASQFLVTSVPALIWKRFTTRGSMKLGSALDDTVCPGGAWRRRPPFT